MRSTKIHYIIAPKEKNGEKAMILKVTRDERQITYIGMISDRIIKNSIEEIFFSVFKKYSSKY